MKRLKLSSEYLPTLHEYGLSHLPIQSLYLLQFTRGEYLYQINTKPEYLMIVVKGRAKVCRPSENGRSLMLAFYGGAGLMGDIELLTDSETSTSDAQAISDFTAIGIPFALKDQLLSSTTFLLRVARGLAFNVDHNSQNMVATVLNSLEARLCSYIAIMQVDGHFKENLSELAELLGTSYRHLLRTLSALCDSGVLRKIGLQYFIQDPPALKKLGGDMYRFK